MWLDPLATALEKLKHIQQLKLTFPAIISDRHDSNQII